MKSISTIHQNLLPFVSKFEPYYKPVIMVVGLRLGLGILAFFAYILYPQSPQRSFPNPNPITSDAAIFNDRLLTVWSNWDGNWYLRIAQQGYQADPESQVFFPLYPLLIRLLGELLFDRYLLAGAIISTVMAMLCVILLYELVKRDHDDQLADQTVAYLAIFPTAFYLFALYTESLYLCLVLGSFLTARHYRRWWLSGFLAALAALTRQIGIFIVLPLLVEWVLYRFNTIKTEKGGNVRFFSFETLRSIAHPAILSMGLPMIAFGGWLIYNQLALGNATGTVTSQSSWDRGFAPPWMTIIDALRVIVTPGTDGFIAMKIDWYQANNLLDLSFFLLGSVVFLYGCLNFWRGKLPLPASYLLFFGTGLLLPLFAPSSLWPLMSYPRFLLALFPLFMLWAQFGQRHRWFHYVTFFLWLPLMGLLFMRFINGYWLA